MSEFFLNTFKNKAKNRIATTIILPALLLIPTTTSASIIEYYSGIELSGTSTTPSIDEMLTSYEKGLLQNTGSYASRQNSGGLSIKYSRDLIINNVDVLRGQQRILDADFTSKFAVGFRNENSRDSFSQAVADKTFSNIDTNQILAGTSLLNNFGLDVENESDQGRSESVDFFDDLLINAPYSAYYLDLSFEHQMDRYTSDFSYLNEALNDALNSFYVNSNLLSELVAVEHDFSLSISPIDERNFSGSGSRRLWFTDEVTASSALDFFNNDTTFVENAPDGGWQDLYLNNRISSDLTFSNVSTQVLRADSWTDGTTTPVIDVPEPTTFAIFSLGLVGLMTRRFKK